MLDLQTLVNGAIPFVPGKLQSTVEELLQQFVDSYCLFLSGYKIDIRLERVPIDQTTQSMFEIFVDVPDLIPHLVTKIDISPTLAVMRRGRYGCGGAVIQSPNALFARIVGNLLDAYPHPYRLALRSEQSISKPKIELEGFRELNFA